MREGIAYYNNRKEAVEALIKVKNAMEADGNFTQSNRITKPTPFIEAVSVSFLLDVCDLVYHSVVRDMYRKMCSTDVVSCGHK